MARRHCIFDDDKTSLDFKMVLVDRKIRAIPNVEINEISPGSKDGSIPTKVKLGKGSIKLTFECFASQNKVYDYIRDFINYLNPKFGQKKIVFSDEREKYRVAILSNSNEVDYFYARFLTFGKFELDFTMFDPFTYSNKVNRYYYNGKNGATTKLINSGGDNCPLKIKVYAPKGSNLTRYEEEHTSVVYTGDWEVYSTSYFSGGKSKFANGTGSSANLIFYGTGVKVYGLKSAGKGIANIYIDNKLVVKADCYAPTEQWSVILFEKTDLSNEMHTIKIEVAGEKNEKAIGYQVNIDCIDVISSSIPSEYIPLEIQGDIFSYEKVPKISNIKISINNEYIKYKSELNEADELVIDTRDFEMELNKLPCLKHWEGDFPELRKGENVIKVEDLEGLGALVLFEYCERWL